MLIDTHVHLNFDAFSKDADEVIRRCLDNGIWMINVGSNYETSKKAVEIAEKYVKGVYPYTKRGEDAHGAQTGKTTSRYGVGVFASVGLHPINLDTGLIKMRRDEVEGCYFEREFEYERYKELILSGGCFFGDPPRRRVVAIGEIGLDYYWRPKTTAKKELFKQKQKDLLEKELELAKELNLPVIFHCRVAHDDLIDFLSKNPEIRPDKAVAHGFVGNLEQLKKYLDSGFFIGFNGIIFKKIEGINFEENIKNTPLERILVETDCPYLSPPPATLRKRACSRSDAGGAQEKELQVRNEPIAVKYVAEEIAKIKDLSYEEVAETTTKNAKKLFQI